MNIRQLQKHDLALLFEMLSLFAEAFDDQESYGANPPDRQYGERLLSSDAVLPLVALDGETMTGAIVAYELMKFEQARSEIYIYDLAVRKSHRRRGIATQLIDALKAIARARGAWVIFVQADYDNEPAIALYTKLGVREDVMHFDIAVDA